MRKQSTQLIIAAALSFVIGLTGLAWIRMHRTRDVKSRRQKPGYSLPINEAGFKHPGDIERGRRQLQTLYAAIVKFRQMHKALPKFWDDLEKDKLISEDQLKNDDVKYTDNYTPGAFNQFLMWQTGDTRPDGSPKPATPQAGEKDVWLVSNLFHRYSSRSPDGKAHGFYQVLYSDGSIVDVKQSETLMMPESSNPKIWDEIYPDEAGTPKTALTYPEYARKHGIPENG